MRLADDTIRPVTDPWLTTLRSAHSLQRNEVGGEEWIKVPTESSRLALSATNAKMVNAATRRNGTDHQPPPYVLTVPICDPRL